MYKLTYRKFEKRWANVFQIYPNAIIFDPLQFCPSMSLLVFPVFCSGSSIVLSHYFLYFTCFYNHLISAEIA